MPYCERVMDDPHFTGFLKAVDDAPTLRLVWGAALAYARTEGFVRLAYVSLPQGRPGELAFVEGYRTADAAAYARERLWETDPVVRVALRGADPFRWWDAPVHAVLTPAEAAQLARGRAHIGEGFAFGVFGPEGRNGFCALGYDPGPADAAAAPALGRIHILRAACQIAHLRSLRLADGPTAEAPALSAREREVLQWIARGKSNAAIAAILGCSVHTVDTHVRRIFAKLDVSDRITAVVRAVGAGIVST